MSVQLEKDRIIITIPATSPEQDLKEMQADLIFAMQSFNHNHMSHNFYKLLDLLEAMIPDSKTFESKEEVFLQMAKQAEKVSA